MTAGVVTDRSARRSQNECVARASRPAPRLRSLDNATPKSDRQWTGDRQHDWDESGAKRPKATEWDTLRHDSITVTAGTSASAQRARIARRRRARVPRTITDFTAASDGLSGAWIHKRLKMRTARASRLGHDVTFCTCSCYAKKQGWTPSRLARRKPDKDSVDRWHRRGCDKCTADSVWICRADSKPVHQGWCMHGLPRGFDERRRLGDDVHV